MAEQEAKYAKEGACVVWMAGVAIACDRNDYDLLESVMNHSGIAKLTNSETQQVTLIRGDRIDALALMDGPQFSREHWRTTRIPATMWTSGTSVKLIDQESAPSSTETP